MWNYRIIKDKDSYGLYEVIYNDEGKIFAHSEEPEIVGESPKDLLDTLELMIHDVNSHIIDGKEILNFGEIKFSKLSDDDEEFVEIDINDLK